MRNPFVQFLTAIGLGLIAVGVIAWIVSYVQLELGSAPADPETAGLGYLLAEGLVPGGFIAAMLALLLAGITWALEHQAKRP